MEWRTIRHTTFICAVTCRRRNVTVISPRKQSTRAGRSVRLSTRPPPLLLLLLLLHDDVAVIYSHVCRRIKPSTAARLTHPPRPSPGAPAAASVEKVLVLVQRWQATQSVHGPTSCPARPRSVRCRPVDIVFVLADQFPARIGLNFEPAACVIASIPAAAEAAAACSVSSPSRGVVNNNNNNNNNQYLFNTINISLFAAFCITLRVSDVCSVSDTLVN